MKKYALIIALAMLAASPSLAGDMPVNADGLTWGPVPPVLPKGRPDRRPIRGPVQRRTLCTAAEDAREL